jgi:hypothetical protein
MTINRRTFLTTSATAVLGAVFADTAPTAFGSGTFRQRRTSDVPPLAPTPDSHGLLIPEGFTSRIIGIGGEPVAGTGTNYIAFPDGGGVIADKGGRWRYLVNSNVLTLSLAGGGAGSAFAITFAPDGEIVDAETILADTSANSGGTVTPWGTWLSGEEDPLYDQGRVFEADPAGEKKSVPRTALGVFSHAGIACTDTGVIYLTQAHPAGLLYRFTPNEQGSVREGTLDACLVVNGSVVWIPIPDPSAETGRLLDQAAGATPFPNARLAWSDGTLYLSQSNGEVASLDTTTGTIATVATGLVASEQPGDICVRDNVYVASGLSVVSIDTKGVVTEVVRIVEPGHEASTLGGLAFDPSGTRLYFSSRRGPTAKTLGEIIPGLSLEETGCGITYEVAGNFGNTAVAPTTTIPDTTIPDTTVSPTTDVPATTAVPATTSDVPAPDTTTVAGRDTGSGPLPFLAAVAAAGVVGASIYAIATIARRKNVVAAETDIQTHDVDSEEQPEQPSTGRTESERTGSNGNTSDTDLTRRSDGSGENAPDTTIPSRRKVFELDETTNETRSSKRRVFELDDDSSKLAVPTRWQESDGHQGLTTSPDAGEQAGGQDVQGDPGERSEPS